MRSPHLVTVTDVNEESGLYYLVMEFVRGESAGAALKRAQTSGQPGLAEAIALEICIAATQGLAAAHTQGIIHRDIKPDNIMIPSRGTPGSNESSYDYAAAKLADLGLARDEGMDATLTAKDSAMGTPGFMSPEPRLRMLATAACPRTCSGHGRDALRAAGRLLAVQRRKHHEEDPGDHRQPSRAGSDDPLRSQRAYVAADRSMLGQEG